MIELLLALLLTTSQSAETQAVITTYVVATQEHVSPTLAVCIMMCESHGHAWAVGDGGEAVGLWQWHLDSWQHVQRKRGMSLEDGRTDIRASTEAAVWALAQGNTYRRWWATLPLCECAK